MSLAASLALRRGDQATSTLVVNSSASSDETT